MRKRLLITILVASFTLNCCPILAQQLLINRYMEQGQKALDDREYEKAEQLFSAALKEANGVNQDAALYAMLLLSFSELKLGKNRDAEKLLIHALEMAGTNTSPKTETRLKFALGINYLAERKLELAETTLRSALRCAESNSRSIDPQIEANIVKALAEVFRKRGKLAEADALMPPADTHKESVSDKSNPMVELAEQLDMALNVESSIADKESGDEEALSENSNLNPSAYKSLCTRGSLCLQSGDLAEAERDFRAAHNIAGELADAVVGLGRVDCRRGNFEKAVRRYTQALAIKPGSTSALANRAIAHWVNGDREIAMADLNTAINKEPHNSKLKQLKDKLATTGSSNLPSLHANEETPLKPSKSAPAVTIPGIGAMATPQVPPQNTKNDAIKKSTPIDDDDDLPEKSAKKDSLPRSLSKAQNVIIIVDCSSRMRDKVASLNQTKIELAKRFVIALIDSLPKETNIGLRVYGQSLSPGGSDNPCRATALLSILKPASNVHRQELADLVNGLEPVGEETLAWALLNAYEDDFRKVAGSKAFVLLSDGIDQCGGDVNVMLKQIVDKYPGLAAPCFVFDVSRKTYNPAVWTIAKVTGGELIERIPRSSDWTN